MQRCTQFLQLHEVNVEGEPLLLAVRGGMDSMCMLHLLVAMKARVHVAHMNYGLRGTEADADTELVKTLCAEMNIEFSEKKVNLRGLMEDSQANLQETGRQLRYAWFEELADALDLKYICTAHHQDDAAETFLVNALRGTGLKGLTGIPVLRDRILRPMLCFTREEIKVMVEEKGITYRDDASNIERDYLRNRIRLDVIPVLQSERPGFIQRMDASQKRLFAEHLLLNEYLLVLKAQLVQQKGKSILIDLGQLMQFTSPVVVLQFILQEYGFRWSQCEHIIARPQAPGNQYLSPTHTLLVDRQKLILIQRDIKADNDVISLEGEGDFILPDGILTVQGVEAIQLSEDPNIEFVDAGMLREPMKIRHWEKGDFFYPLGSGGKQKLQDYFTNNKLSITDKSRALILTSGGDIVWVIGRRLDHRFRITPQSRKVLRLEWKPAGIY